MERLLSLALRASVMYVVALGFVRLSGKRSLGKISPLDFVAVTILGDLFDDVFWAEVPLGQALTAFATIILLHTAVAYGEWRVPWIMRLVSGTPTAIIRDSAWRPEGLLAEHTPVAEVLSELRREGIEGLADIERAQWEPSGQISMKSTSGARLALKRDLSAREAD